MGRLGPFLRGSCAVLLVALAGCDSGSSVEVGHDPYFDSFVSFPEKWGRISAVAAQDGPNSSAFALFGTVLEEREVSRTIRRRGSCVAIEELGRYPIGVTTSDLVDPGVVSMTSPWGDMPLLQPGDGRLSFSFTAPEGNPVWRTGDSVTFTTSGRDVPAFSATITFPPSVRVPLPREASPLDRDRDFVVSWPSASGEETVELLLESLLRKGDVVRTVSILCHSVPKESGLKVPRELLSLFEPPPDPSNPYDGSVKVTAGIVQRLELSVGEFLVDLSAATLLTHAYSLVPR